MTTILYRRGVNPDEDDLEVAAASRYFKVVHQRTEIPLGDLVIGRMSVLPFYKELEKDINNQGGRLINTFRQHQYIADMREWCASLGELTPKLYERLQDCPAVGPFVVKGQTNSRKFQWDTHMFAKDRRAVMEVYGRLKEDSLFLDQEIYARDYVPLQRLMTAFNGLPITKEFRFFVCNGKILTGAFYWQSHLADLKDVPMEWEVPRHFLDECVRRIGGNANFYALDVAKTQKGEWTVIEINDGQMSGLSCNDADKLYRALKEHL